jgi:hypothetical protein
MATGGLTYGAAKSTLCRVVDNGIAPDDTRVLDRTNEATKVILDHLVPVNGMMTIEMNADGQVILLPKELENAIDVEVMQGQTVRGDTDFTRAFYDVVNQFAYVDPSMMHDNPLIDNGLVADVTDPTILRRQYTFPGLQANARLRITGAKRYQPITSDDEYLIVQNLEGLKLIILSIERYENNDPTNAALYRQQGIEMLQAEVKKHILDPRNVLARQAAYKDDESAYAPGSFGNTRARLALEVPGAILFGKQEVSRILNEAERRLMSKGTWRNCLREFHATITSGPLLFPRDVESILAAEICGRPLDIRSIFFSYLENGPGKWGSCYTYLEDKGEEYFPTSRNSRRRYELVGGPDVGTRMTFIAKLRWVEKKPNDQMVIKHFEALRLMTTAIVLERGEKWELAKPNGEMAVKELQDDLGDYLRGIKHTLPIETFGFGMGDVGCML